MTSPPSGLPPDPGDPSAMPYSVCPSPGKPSVPPGWAGDEPGDPSAMPFSVCPSPGNPSVPPDWAGDEPGVLTLPSGRLVRGRGLCDPMPSGHPPTLGIYLLGAEPPAFGWESRWIPWPDFRLPRDPALLRATLIEALAHATTGRVELACEGGRGRTGTALACLAVLDGVPPREAVEFVRRHYHFAAAETPWQKKFVRNFAPA
jgi:hypothetical protein